jgi:hypothetical protein
MEYVCVLLFPFLIVYLLAVTSFGVARLYVGEDCCAKYRYPITGLKAELCPECGGFLSGTGALRVGLAQPVYDPPDGLKWVCRVILLAGATVIALVIAWDRLPRTWSDSVRVIEKGQGWTATVQARGTLDVSPRRYWWGGHGEPLCIPRAKTLVTVRTDDGEVGTIRMLDIRRHAVLTAPDGSSHQTQETVTEEDIRGWAARFSNERVRSGLGEAARTLNVLLGVCATGSTSLEDSQWSRWCYPQVQWGVPLLLVYVAVLYFVFRWLRRAGPLMLRRRAALR